MKNSRTMLFAAFVCMLFVSAVRNEPGYQVGDTVNDFQLKNIDDKIVSLKDYDQVKGFIVIFTCNTCPFAVAYEDRIVALNNKYASKGYPVIAINPNDVGKQPGDSFEHMKKRAKDKNFSFPYLYDEKQETARLFGATKTPHVYILSKSSNGLTVEYIGAIDDNSYSPKEVKVRYAENALEELLEGKKITQTNTKAIGCTIKWKNS